MYKDKETKTTYASHILHIGRLCFILNRKEFPTAEALLSFLCPSQMHIIIGQLRITKWAQI